MDFSDKSSLGVAFNPESPADEAPERCRRSAVSSVTKRRFVAVKVAGSIF